MNIRLSSHRDSGLTILAAVVLWAVVVALAAGVAMLLRRFNEIPPLLRRAEIQQGEMPGSCSDLWAYMTNHGDPPSFTFRGGIDSLPNVWGGEPLRVGTNVYDYYEAALVGIRPVEILMSCSIRGGWTTVATVGVGTNMAGFTNDTCRVFMIDGAWSMEPTERAVSNCQMMFWKGIPK